MVGFPHGDARREALSTLLAAILANRSSCRKCA
jgi:hypothetical protein